MRTQKDAPDAPSRPYRAAVPKRLGAPDDKPGRRRRKELDLRLEALRKAAGSPDLPSDSRAFLLLALGRLDALLEGLPAAVRGQELTLSWLEGLLAPLESQARAWPPELAPFATRLPTTVAEEERRRQALSLLELTGARLLRERAEILESLDEVEAGLA